MSAEFNYRRLFSCLDKVTRKMASDTVRYSHVYFSVPIEPKPLPSNFSSSHVESINRLLKISLLLDTRLPLLFIPSWFRRLRHRAKVEKEYRYQQLTIKQLPTLKNFLPATSKKERKAILKCDRRTRSAV